MSLNHQYTDFTSCYRGLIEDVYKNADFVASPRGMKVHEKLAVRFEIENPRNRLLYNQGRNFSITYTIAEALWYLLGENRTDWISNYAKFWEPISDDGSTANSAYGARLFKKHPRIDNGLQNQWEFVKSELRRDRDSRRAVIHIHTPEDSRVASKDVPCTLSLQFFIRREKLYMVTSMRSSDLILGIAYDIPAFTLFQELLALELGLELGTYTHISNSLHIYERDFKMCDQILSAPHTSGPEMPPMVFRDSLESSLQWLDKVQWTARNTHSEPYLESIFALIDESPHGDYWKDWAQILVAHRAGKLGLDQLKSRYLLSTRFVGYRQFER